MDLDALRIGRDRLSRVFQYLEALNQHRNPVRRQIREQLWTLWLKDLPDHPSVQRGRPGNGQQNKADTASPSGAPDGDDFILKVARPKLTRPPDPGSELQSWLESGWEDPAKELAVKKTRNEPGLKNEVVLIRFDDDPNRTLAFETWKPKRQEWAKNERPARAAARIFENLYQLYGRIEREAERVELVLGDGILSWRRQEGGIFHPVLLQRLQMSFDPSIPEFRITETEHSVELYSALFQSVPEVDGRAIGRCREELEQGDYHPLGDRETAGFLKRLVIQLSPRGDFVESGAPDIEKDDPRIGRSPVLFLRSRTLGFAAAIEAVLEDLRTREDLPWSLLNIVGVDSPNPTEENNSDKRSSVSQFQDVLLSKPANPEQIRIAQRTETTGGILVQGPPGTGKTHTIGNLIGHLLAQGKSILVTSHTTKALRMVRSQVASKLRSLCVSVLESDLDSRKQLESAVGTIAERLSRAHSTDLELEAERLRKRREGLQGKLAHCHERLANARADEYRDVVVAGKSWSPSDAARWVAKQAKRCAWIPSPVTLGAAMPLSQRELAELYSTNRSIPSDAERELSQSLPDSAQLPSPAEFEALAATRAHLSRVDREGRSDLWQSATSTVTAEFLSAIITQIQQAIEPLAGGERWKLAAVYAGKNGGPHREPWDNLVAFIEQVHLEVASSQEILYRHSTVLDPSSSFEDQENIALEIQSHLQQNGRLGLVTLLTHPNWKHLVQTVTVNGAQPKGPEHFLAISKLCRVKFLRHELSARWDRQMEPLGAPPARHLGDEIEKSTAQYCDPLRDCLTWSSRAWGPVENELKQAGFLWERFMAEQTPAIGSDGELYRLRQAVTTNLLPILAARVNSKLWERNEKLLSGLQEALSHSRSVAADSVTVAHLYDAVSKCDPESFRDAHARLLELQSLRTELARRKELLSRIEVAAPAWANAVRARTGIHGAASISGDAADAWTWRQLHDELEDRASVSIEEIQASIDRCTQQLREVTIEPILLFVDEPSSQKSSLLEASRSKLWISQGFCHG